MVGKGNGLGTVVAILSTASRLGVIVSNILLGPLLVSLHWHTILLISGMVYCGGSALTYAVFSAASQTASASSTTAPADRNMASMATLLHVTLTTPRILLALAIAGVLNPAFNFSENHNIPSQSR